jgi:Ca-activated chloride channel family protein
LYFTHREAMLNTRSDRSRMRLASLILFVSALLPQQPAFKTGVETVAIYATVRDAEGRSVPDLTREDFEILDNGKPVEITTFSSGRQPLTVALLLDMSGSMNPSVLRVRESTRRFIDALLPDDRVRICTFGDEIAISPILTNDKAVLTRIVSEELWPGGGTPLWNAVYAGMDSLADEPGRRVVLALTDGEDGGSLPGWKGSFRDVRDRATRDGFMLYMVGMDKVATRTDLHPEVAALLDETGGAHLNVAATDDLGGTFTRVAEELRRQYLLGFMPAVDGREHRLTVSVKRAGLLARARKSYTAERPVRAR